MQTLCTVRQLKCGKADNILNDLIVYGNDTLCEYYSNVL